MITNSGFVSLSVQEDGALWAVNARRSLFCSERFGVGKQVSGRFVSLVVTVDSALCGVAQFAFEERRDVTNAVRLVAGEKHQAAIKLVKTLDPGMLVVRDGEEEEEEEEEEDLARPW